MSNDQDAAREIWIYGASDDLIEVDGAFQDEFNAYGQWRGELCAPNGDRLIVTGQFCKPGADAEWTLSIENTTTYPSWPFRFAQRPDRDGDPALVVAAPEGTTLTEISSGEVR